MVGRTSTTPARGQNLQSLREFDALHLLHKFKNIAAQAAAEAMPDLLRRGNHERRSFFVVKRTKPPEIRPGFLELHILADKIDDIELSFDFFRGEHLFQ